MRGRIRRTIFENVFFDDRTADDQREADDPRIEQNFLDVFAGNQPDDHCGEKCHQYADDKAAVIGIGEHAKRDPPQFGEIDHNDGEDGAELDQDVEALPEIILAEIEKTAREQQMAGRGHRQEFRDALDHAENHRPYCI